MDPRVVVVLELLAQKESSDGHAEVTELRPENGIVVLRHGDTLARLHFDEAVMLAFIAEAGRDTEEVWGSPLPDEEAAARFLSIHLDESLATREPTNRDGGRTGRAGSIRSRRGKGTRSAIRSRERDRSGGPADSTA